jgi:hypothetical protein
LRGGEEMRELTREEILEIMCVPAQTDEPEESDFVEESELDERAEEIFVKNWIEGEMK